MLKKHYQDARALLNVYGPTEATVLSTTYTFTSPNTLPNTIGKPLANAQLYVLDINNQPCPIGVVGELHIGGAGLARGYLNQPELTAEKFIPNPFSDKTNDRLYKTGDLVRWLPDGNLEYIGRIDFQVKVRGFRIELGEIESALHRIPTIQQSLTSLYQKDSNDLSKKLVTYYVAKKPVE